MPDYFDRLLARYTPVPAAGGGAARVRPRLPGPFERIEALRTAPPEPDEPAALIPTAAGPASHPVEAAVRHEREVRTDHHTVVHAKEARAAEPGPAVVTPLVPAPLLRAAVPAPVRGRPAAEPAHTARRAAGGAERSEAPRTRAAGAPRTVAAPPVAVVARPPGSGTADARVASPGGVGRRAPRPAERIVHVQIGRLEVTAAPPPGAKGPGGPGAGAGQGGRKAPALSLDDYLSRGERNN